MSGGGGGKCRILILRNCYVPRHYLCNYHKTTSCHMSKIRYSPCRISYFSSHVTPCRTSILRNVEFRGQGPRESVSVRRRHVVRSVRSARTEATTPAAILRDQTLNTEREGGYKTVGGPKKFFPTKKTGVGGSETF